MPDRHTEMPQGPMQVARLNRATGLPFSIVPSAEARKEIAERLGISAVRKLRFEGDLTAEGGADWRLDARLGATVVQPCVVTNEPVTTRIDDDVGRLFTANPPDIPDEAEAEIEIPEDTDVEPLGRTIDLHAVMEEALALALPLYPRTDGADLGEAVFTEPGKAAMTDEDAHPFAALKAIRGGKDAGS